MKSLSKCLRISAFTLTILAVSEVMATPITFRYEAKLTNIFNGDTFDPGLDIALGDSITGSFTFEPIVSDGKMFVSTIQMNKFVLSIDGTEFVSSSYESQSSNDSTASDFPVSVIDTIRLAGTGLFPAVSGATPAIDSINSAFSISLHGQASSLSQAGLPHDASIWNRLTVARTLNIGLNGAGTNSGGIGLQATISDFLFVPEPASLSVVFTVLILFFTFPISNSSLAANGRGVG